MRWGAAGIALVAAFVAMSVISSGFDYGLKDLEKPIITLVSLMMGAAVVYLIVVFCFEEKPFGRGLILWVFLVGFLLRLIMFPSTPMLEDDHYRYMWDGGVLANGFNSYKYSPRDILYAKDKEIPADLRRLAKDAKPTVRRINHPWLRTIYPPVAQGAFAMAHMIRPWSLEAWRLILLTLDVATLILLFALLRKLNLPIMGLVIYWWNPLLVKEVYNSGHMDVVIFPFILMALLFALNQRYLWASGAVGLAVGAKFWPVILLPVMLRPIFREPKRLVPSVFIFTCLFVAALLPFYLSGLDNSSGVTSYSKQWEMNDALFMVLLWVVKSVIKALSLNFASAQAATRGLVSLILFLWIFWVIRRDDRDPVRITRRCLMAVSALFLLSPTQFPWYFLWLLPFLALCPMVSLLSLTLLLPLYYLRNYFDARGMPGIHDHGIVWVEFVPIWGLLFWEWYNERKKKT